MAVARCRRCNMPFIVIFISAGQYKSVERPLYRFVIFGSCFYKRIRLFIDAYITRIHIRNQLCEFVIGKFIIHYFIMKRLVDKAVSVIVRCYFRLCFGISRIIAPNVKCGGFVKSAFLAEHNKSHIIVGRMLVVCCFQAVVLRVGVVAIAKRHSFKTAL